ncbi:hypothetical protein [Parafilimonas terrae]|uniref:hypothetical protein n=1 Tax=Parafilimonas terrae TaxID=1465490 RepID=UPI000B891C1A|nr:hypothetical protein [Parafilimonas terrae]
MTAEESAAQKPNQGMCADVLKDHLCLNFFGYFLFSRKESNNKLIVIQMKKVQKEILVRWKNKGAHKSATLLFPI